MQILLKRKYHVLHCHNYGYFGPYLLLGTLRSIPIRIVHSHNGGSVNESKTRLFFRRLWNFINFDFLITHKVACSNFAACWLYSEHQFQKGKTITLYNGIDFKKFAKTNQITYNKNKENVFQFINVGRFNVQKNQSFLIDIFFEMNKINEDIFLNIVGLGPFENKLKNQVKSLKLDTKVRFYDFDTDIPQLLNRMDYFLLPSLWEGFPITALEAQAAGLPIFISDTVTKEVDMGLATYLPVSKGPKYWADYIFNAIESNSIPVNIDLKKQKQFDIRNVAHQFEELYSS